MVECVGLLSESLQSEAVPLLVDLAVDLDVSAEAPCVVFGDELMQQSFDEQLERHSLDDIAEQDHILTLTDHRNVFLLDRRCFLEFSDESAIDPEQVLSIKLALVS